MNFQRGRRHEEFEMNLVPLIDVLLVIIIFLVVNATFAHTSELKINLPTAQANVPQPKPSTIEVAVDAGGHYAINGKSIIGNSVAALNLAISTAAHGENPTIIISADAKTPHQAVVNVMEAARMGGFLNLTFATQSQ